MNPEHPVEYVLPSTDAEAQRLEMQAAQLHGGTSFLAPFLAKRPAKVLDVGCGTGLICRYVAAHHPESEVHGVEQDAGRLAFAKKNNPHANLEFHQASLYSLPFADGQFDLVFCSRVLVHADDLGRALGEMIRVIRDGGQLVAFEPVHDGVWFSPPRPAFARALRAVINVMQRRGMEPSQGLYVASEMVRRGLQQVQAEVVPHSCLAHDELFEAYVQNWFETFEGLRTRLEPHIEPSIFDEALKELKVRKPDDFLVEISVLASGIRSM